MDKKTRVGRPLKYSEPCVRVDMHIPKSLLSRLDVHACAAGMSRTEFIVRMLKAKLK